ncbi:Phosphatidylinositol 4,5-bisphosphate-binding protein SLM1 [Pseudocercospora fuligena]|uniref:Phosphatidylinositol 4,5-bisphosphate-binding protein SLM1 n=1 Tax=Pseudocercospora fuligena TaxID=685502 RepID=A0A8H6RI94_9PEZI|nr:Phosphatidylinositol 4,5-bisphosphate-binding protein SLM1 [Pseudocercospora fuligena]
MSTPYGSVPQPSGDQVHRGYGTQPTDFAIGSNPTMSSPLSNSVAQQGHFTEEFDASQRGSSVVDGGLQRSSSRASTLGGTGGVSRSNTLKKKNSVKRASSLKRSGSKKSLRAGSIKGLGGIDADDANFSSWSFTPVPTTGTPTDILANRFQAWRQLLKSLITYFREIQQSYETRHKALHKVQNTISNITNPSIFMSNGGLGEATRILENFHGKSVREAQKARDIETDVIQALTGLRSDLAQKIKEIKSLSGDFKNSVDKERDVTRKEIEKLQEALQHADHEDGAASGKNDPYVVRLGVDRAIERQIDEENYLHRAYLNLEASGRELESIVVGEIQKAYNALAGILKREADDAYNTVESLRSGPIAMPKDQEWYQFVTSDEHFVDPGLPLRRVEEIEYPGKHAPAATEIRAGMLERKSKYLKSYTPGWYVLSPTHLHEFKSADKIYSQPPVMSLYLPDQKLGSHSERGSSSHKFMLKGKQSGGMHKGHNWVFRAESYDTMMAWLEDIRSLTEKTGAERNAFIRKHARSMLTAWRHNLQLKRSLSGRNQVSETRLHPYLLACCVALFLPIGRTQLLIAIGGRFPSDMVLRKTGTMSSTADGADDSDDDGPNAIAAASALPVSSPDRYGGQDPYRLDDVRTEIGTINDEPGVVEHQAAPIPIQQQTIASTEPVQTQTYALPAAPVQPINQAQPVVPEQQQQPFLGREPATSFNQVQESLARHNSGYGDWMAPAAAGVAGVGAGALGAEAYQHHQREQEPVVPQEIPVEEKNSLRGLDADAGAFVFPNAVGESHGTEPMLPSVPPASDINHAPVVAAPLTTATDASATSTGVAEAPLGGNEKLGAHETGAFFPRVIRHDTELSVSQLHVPGEFPPQRIV